MSEICLFVIFDFNSFRDYCPKQGPIDIQDCRSQQGQQTQQSTGVTLVVTEETYWPMPTATGSVRCVFLVVVSLLIGFFRLCSHGLPNHGYNWCVNKTHTTDVPLKKRAAGGDSTRAL